MKAWKRGSLVASVLMLFVIATLLTGCLNIPSGERSGYTILDPNGQQVAGYVDSSFTDGDKIMTITLAFDTGTKTCSFNPSVLLVKIPDASSTTPFTTTLSCNNQQSTVQGEVDHQGNVSLTFSGWTS